MLEKSIILIGMPGSGKSTIGKSLANYFKYHFIDTDDYIEKKEKKSLQQLINEVGDEEFCSIEEKRVLELLPIMKCVLAPGGSIIYSKVLMQVLKNNSIIVFLDLPLKEIVIRLDNKESRGIVGLKSKNIKQLYAERIPLYNKYGDIKISCYEKSETQITEEIIIKIENLENLKFRKK